MSDAKIIVTTTPEQRAEIAAHWRQVREGLQQSAPHKFRDDLSPAELRDRAIWNLKQAAMYSARFHQQSEVAA